jgi:HK97 family phage major capsid protein
VLTPKKVAALSVFSNEAVNDSDPSVVNAVGQAMVRAVAAEADKGILVGAGGAKGPTGILSQIVATQAAPVGYTSIVSRLTAPWRGSSSGVDSGVGDPDGLCKITGT